MKFYTYLGWSLLAMLGMMYYAYYTRQQFYPTILYLVSSKTCFLVAGNLAFAFSMLFARLIKTVFFGNLREVEAELLIEKAKYTIIETCLALTIFRNELNPTIFALFGSLIFFKLMHKLSKCRLEYLEQISPVPSLLLVRMGILLVSLMITDSIGLYFSVQNVLVKGRSVVILFGFEFGLLLIYSFNLSLKFCFQILDSFLTNGFVSRGFATMIADLVCEVVKFITYIALFCMIFIYYGLPFHLIRDVYAAYYSFQKKLLSFIRYLQLTKNLDSRFPDASPEELALAGSCLVCREEMTQGKRLHCGHVFHLDCLRMWLQHQQSCPLCRAEISTEAVPPPPAINHPHQQPFQDRVVPAEDLGDAENEVLSNNLASVKTSTGELELGSRKFPAFFVLKNDLLVFRESSFQSAIVRNLTAGSVVFIFSRRLTSDGKHWLKLADGWILEEMGKVSNANEVVPLLTEKRVMPDTDPKSENLEEEFLKRLDLDVKFRSTDEKLLAVLKKLSAIETQLSELSKTARECRQTLMIILQDEDK